MCPGITSIRILVGVCCTWVATITRTRTTV
nr:MAG TPA: hypothetical protein [Caudoviricetes sp.]